MQLDLVLASHDVGSMGHSGRLDQPGESGGI